ncbi:MAG: recombinase family protein [Planctomycetes bacterium]|nr:recombinase family protein [Planctomycetota bacterium]
MQNPLVNLLNRMLNEPPEPEPIRYAIYTRQSVEKIMDFSSCESQFGTCRDFATASGERTLQWCGERFDDEGESGSTLDRPAMARLREAVRAGEIHRIYAVALGRLLEVHTPRRVGSDAEDICVTDGLGKLKVILHHEKIDRGESYKIRQEWPGSDEGRVVKGD